uniref:DDE_3 domain-containing protein n=1 Tax=Heterorhabditis bacteriophora TaxID=37862 RepID=A0A1I7XAS7_HETBA
MPGLCRTTIANIQAKSPDLNPIEKVWHQLKHYLRTEYKLVPKDTLIAGLHQFWKTRMTME